MKRNITLEIGGIKYRMASDADESHLRRLEQELNTRINALGSAAQKVSAAQLLAVVSLGLCEEIVGLKDQRDAERQRVDEVVAHALENIDHRLQGLG